MASRCLLRFAHDSCTSKHSSWNTRRTQALEHLLESYEQDRLRGDDAGVAISLIAIARIFTEEHEYDRARERIREALPLADACGLANIVASLALLWAEIDLAEGKPRLPQPGSSRHGTNSPRARTRVALQT